MLPPDVKEFTRIVSDDEVMKKPAVMRAFELPGTCLEVRLVVMGATENDVYLYEIELLSIISCNICPHGVRVILFSGASEQNIF